MRPPYVKRPASAVAENRPLENCRLRRPDTFSDTHFLRPNQESTPSLVAWANVLSIVAAMKESLDYRIRLEDARDWTLKSDVETWCALANALAGFLEARGSA